MPPSYRNKRNFKNKFQNDGYPDLNLHREEVLIVAKTMPQPSKKYREIVCTAGLTKKGRLIRLYPIPFRYIDFSRRYQKYQWIKVLIEKHKERDKRIDSYRPKVESIRKIGKPLPGGKWKERKKLILPIISSSLEEIKRNYKEKKISLGIFKPKRITFKVAKADEEWNGRTQQILRQKVLIGRQPKKLEKIPYKFIYEFTCDNKKCGGHKLEIRDWEISELYRNLKKRYYPSVDVILEKIKQRWEKEMWDKKRDSYLVVGTVHPYPSFIVIGVFWPPK